MLAGTGPASAAAGGCQSWTGIQPTGPSNSAFIGVAVLTACNAWAVGSAIDGATTDTLIEHWTGTSWTVVPSPDPGSSFNRLTSVRAVSANNIWAVGSFSDDSGPAKTLIVHWDGKAWTEQPSPNPGTATNRLSGVRAVSATDIWAVGSFSSPGLSRTLIVHWDGKAWTQQPSPSFGTSAGLSAVAAASGSVAWAVGQFTDSSGNHALILRWNGTTWSRAASPALGSLTGLLGVGVNSPSSAWAVGFTGAATSAQTLILRWDGTRWRRVPSPAPVNVQGGMNGSLLFGVATTSPGNAWAVGSFNNGTGFSALILRWNGTTWTRAPVASPGSGDRTSLDAVGASSATSAWAVGATSNQPFALRCC
jgi:hypothetical protein